MDSSPPSYEETVKETIPSTIQPTAPIRSVESYGSITENITSGQPSIIDACPVCQIGVLEDDFTCLGIFLAVFCFPVGLICCLTCKNQRCTNCDVII